MDSTTSLIFIYILVMGFKQIEKTFANSYMSQGLCSIYEKLVIK